MELANYLVKQLTEAILSHVGKGGSFPQEFKTGVFTHTVTLTLEPIPKKLLITVLEIDSVDYLIYIGN